MFAYLIIAVELAILYSVFWYVFIREPKPYRVAGNLWGTYDRARESFTTGDIGGHDGSIDDPSIYYAMNARSVVRRHHHSHLTDGARSTIKYGWVAADQKPAGNVLLRLINGLKRSLDMLCVKLP